MRAAVAGASAARHAAALARPFVAGLGSSTHSRPASLLQWRMVALLKMLAKLPGRQDPAGAQLNAEAVEVNQDAHVHAVGCSGATGRRQAARSAPQELLQGLLCEIIVPMIDALLLLFMALML